MNTSLSAEDLFQEICNAIPAPYSTWPSDVVTAIDSGGKFGYLASTYNTISRHKLVIFLLHNGASPIDVVRWLHVSQRVGLDGLCELRNTLQLLNKGNLRNKVLCMRNVNDHRKKTPVLSPTQCSEIAEAVKYINNNAHKGATTEDGLPYMEKRMAYFRDLFPLQTLAELLNRTGSPLQLREVTAGKNSPLFRGRPILAVSQLKWAANKRLTSLHAGSAFSNEQEPLLKGSAPLGTELCLEVDELPKELEGCTDALRWRWMRSAMYLLIATLKRDFNVDKHLLFASGGRGPHLWLLDDFILKQTADTRKSFIARIQRPTSISVDGPILFAPVEEGGFGLNPDKPRSDPERLALVWPVVDVAVALGARHTHRLPFSVHDSTHRIAVPCEIATFPTCAEDMPRVDDPALGEKLKAPLAILEHVLRDLRDAQLVLDAELLNNELERAPMSSWARAACEKKMSQQVIRLTNKPKCFLPPLRIDLGAVDAWSNTIAAAAAAVAKGALLDDLADERVSAMLRKTDNTRDKLLTRLRHEIKRLDLLLGAKAHTLTNEIVEDDAGSRLMVYHANINQMSYVKTIHGVTRHIITNYKLLELDVSGAHPAAAFAAVVAQEGSVESAILKVPKLAMLVLDRASAVQAVCDEYISGDNRPDAAKAKVLLLRSLNQTREDEKHALRKPFLKALVEEREVMTGALVCFPPLAGVTQAIQAKASESGKASTLLSLLMQATENLIIERSIAALATIGWNTVGVISDAVLLERQDAETDVEEARIKMETVAENLGIKITVKIDHKPVATPDADSDLADLEASDSRAAATVHAARARALEVYAAPGDHDFALEVTLDDYKDICINPTGPDGLAVLKNAVAMTRQIMESLLFMRLVIEIRKSETSTLLYSVCGNTRNATKLSVDKQLKRFFLLTANDVGYDVSEPPLNYKTLIDSGARPIVNTLLTFVLSMGLKSASTGGVGLLDSAFDRERFAKAIGGRMWDDNKSKIIRATSGELAFGFMDLKSTRNNIEDVLCAMLWPRLRLHRRRGGQGLARSIKTSETAIQVLHILQDFPDAQSARSNTEMLISTSAPPTPSPPLSSTSPTSPTPSAHTLGKRKMPPKQR